MNTIIKALGLLSLIFLLGACATPDYNPSRSPSDISSSINPETSRKIQDFLEGEIARQEIPGMEVFLRQGEEDWFGAVGTRTLDREEPLTLENKFRIASMSKVYTAVVILCLAEEGLLSLDDPVSLWIPEFASEGITLRHLLNHTAGAFEPLRSFSSLLGTALRPMRAWQEEKMRALIAEKGGVDAPGEFSYSNGGYILLGFIAEEASGRDFSLLLEEYITGPFALEHTYMAPDPSRVGGLLEGYDRSLMPYPNRHKPDYLNWATFAWTSGGMVSRADDMARFLDALFQGELLKPSSLEAMMSFSDTKGSIGEAVEGYGLGLAEFRIKDSIFYGHEGLFIGFQGLLLYNPEQDITLALIANVSEYEPVAVAEGLVKILGD